MLEQSEKIVPAPMSGFVVAIIFLSIVNSVCKVTIVHTMSVSVAQIFLSDREAE